MLDLDWPRILGTTQTYILSFHITRIVDMSYQDLLAALDDENAAFWELQRRASADALKASDAADAARDIVITNLKKDVEEKRKVHAEKIEGPWHLHAMMLNVIHLINLTFQKSSHISNNRNCIKFRDPGDRYKNHREGRLLKR